MPPKYLLRILGFEGQGRIRSGHSTPRSATLVVEDTTQIHASRFGLVYEMRNHLKTNATFRTSGIKKKHLYPVQTVERASFGGFHPKDGRSDLRKIGQCRESLFGDEFHAPISPPRENEHGGKRATEPKFYTDLRFPQTKQLPDDYHSISITAHVYVLTEATLPFISAHPSLNLREHSPQFWLSSIQESK
jgi:hypothetical protein